MVSALVCLILPIVSSAVEASVGTLGDPQLQIAILNELDAVKTELSRVNGLQSRVDFLENALFLQGKQLASHKRQIVSLRKQLTKYESVKARDRAIHDNARPVSVTTVNRTTEKHIPGRGIRSVAGVAFTATLTHEMNHIGIGQTIRYEHVLLNDGAGYNAHTGSFTAPYSGVYLFAYHFVAPNPVGQTWLKLVVNGITQNSGVSDRFHTNFDVQGGNLAIVRLNTNDEVWLEAFHQDDANLHGTSFGFTSFSGILVY